VTEALLRSAKRARRGRNLFLIDLAVPRDVEPSVAKLEGVFLYNVDDLSQVAEASAENRRREAERASELVDRLLVDFLRWLDAEQATPVIKALRARLRESMALEFERSLRGRLKGLDEEQRSAVAKMLDSALNRMLHAPTTRLREEAASEESRDEIAAALSLAFELESVTREMLDRSAEDVPREDEDESLAEEKSLRLVRGS
jgi:glutamyl-tRNA reductase